MQIVLKNVDVLCICVRLPILVKSTDSILSGSKVRQIRLVAAVWGPDFHHRKRTIVHGNFQKTVRKYWGPVSGLTLPRPCPKALQPRHYLRQSDTDDSPDLIQSLAIKGNSGVSPDVSSGCSFQSSQ